MSSGVHHVTAIAGSPQGNIDFYTKVLGLRLVKRTVNFDDPLTYHFYYGTELGAPGTILTFFAWPHAFGGRMGSGQVNGTGLAVPRGALGWWRERFVKLGVAHEERTGERFGEKLLGFKDWDGLGLELVEAEDERPGWKGGDVPAERAITGVHGVTAHEEGYEATAELLEKTLGFAKAGQEGNRFRYAAGGQGKPGNYLDLVCTPDAPRGRGGAGTVHHVAWRVADEAAQAEWRRKLVEAGMNVSPVLDRSYFHSIYFREPGGVLLEMATDGPGFAVDEAASELGRALKLPPWLEAARERIEEGLEKFTVPGGLP